MKHHLSLPLLWSGVVKGSAMFSSELLIVPPVNRWNKSWNIEVEEKSSQYKLRIRFQITVTELSKEAFFVYLVLRGIYTFDILIKFPSPVGSHKRALNCDIPGGPWRQPQRRKEPWQRCHKANVFHVDCFSFVNMHFSVNPGCLPFDLFFVASSKAC